MPGTIVSDQTIIDQADAVTNWLSLGTWAAALVANADMAIQGAAGALNALVGRVSASTAYSLASNAGLNVTTDPEKHFFIWLKNVTWPGTDTKPNGGLRFCLSSDATPTITGVSPADAPTNSKSWNLAGKDTDSTTGWVCYVVAPNGTADLTVGTPVLSSVKRIGFRAKLLSTIGAGNFKPSNLMVDVLRYGTGLGITLGTSIAPVTFVDILAADSGLANAFGVLIKQSGVYYGSGKLSFGTAAQAALTYFKDIGQVLVFQDFPVTATLYTFVLRGAASYATTVVLGDYTAGLASGGCIVRGSGNAVWNIDCDTNSAFKAYACIFSQLRSAALSTTSELRYCTISSSGPITTNGAAVDHCTFQSLATGAPISATNALIIGSVAEMAAVSKCNFISCNRAIRITVAGVYTFDGHQFSGNTYDVENASGGQVTINPTNNCNVATYVNTGAGSATTINTISRTLSLTGVKDGSEIRVYKQSDGTEVAGIETYTGPTAFTYSYPYTGDLAVNIVVFHVSYLYVRIPFTLANSDSSIPIQQIFDREYSNPA